MRVEVILAWPDAFRTAMLELPAGACVADAVAAADLDPERQSVGLAVHGVVARPEQPLHEGDRVELLRPLLIDPKEARRRRARPA
ncbi:RnfH family protein [Xanthomonas sp. Kuri4-1]